MNPSSSPRPIEKSVVLVGAGNAHLVFVRRWGMRPIPGVGVTLVNTTAVVPYSAMVPGHVGGDYRWDEITIDLVKLCQSVKVRFLAAATTGIDPSRREIHFANRPALHYDVLALGIGALPRCPLDPTSRAISLPLRPLGQLVQRLEEIDADLGRSPRPFHLAVVGGGASGCELALAAQKRLGQHVGFRVSLFQGDARLVPQLAAGVARYFEQAFAARGIAWLVNSPVAGVANGMLLFKEGTETIPVDAVLWATQAEPHELLRASGLPVNSEGFLKVLPTLQSEAYPEVFGSGDCVSFALYPDLPRNGVHAVRQGRVLFDNVNSYLHDKPLRPFRPQRLCLVLLNNADGQSILSYGALSWKGRWLRWLKDRIDRAWMAKFTRFKPMAGAETGDGAEPLMRCGGCGSKISQDVLSAVLARLEIADDPRILLGCRAGEDAAVHRVKPELFSDAPEQLVEVQTVDYFKAFIDDPYLFGRIAALHAVSDLYAMNARPFSALAIATLPYARGPIQKAQLFELLSGAVASLREQGVVLTGGHTTEGSELALGFAVTGFAEEDRLFQKSRLRPGDQLILTKPLGSGALLAAWMRGQCRASWFQDLTAGMLLSNAAASKIFREAGVVACTDVTGFGLAGHLLEMLDASRVAARLIGKEMALYPGFVDVVNQGIASSLHDDNARNGCRVRGPSPLPAWLYDPQTSGGLLAAVRPERAVAALNQLRQAGYLAAKVVGTIVATSTAEQPHIMVE